MKRSDAAEHVVRVAETYLQAFDAHKVDPVERMEAVLRNVERNAARAREAFEAATGTPGEVTAEEERAFADFLAALVSLAAAALVGLVIQPIDAADLPPFRVLAGRSN